MSYMYSAAMGGGEGSGKGYGGGGRGTGYLQENNKNSVSVEVVGESGIGKTSTIVELAQDNNLKFVKRTQTKQ